jgi:hypothetical protein
VKATCEVLAEEVAKISTKRGEIEIYLLVCVDLWPRAGLRNTFDYKLSEDERMKFAGKVTGQRVELALLEMRHGFGGRVQFSGRILSFNGEEVMD